MSLHLDTSTGKTIGVARIEGRLDATNSGSLLQKFPEWLEQTNHFVFDCSALSFIDSSGLGAIVGCLRKALEKNGDLRLACLDPKVSMVFELTKAKQLFSIYADSHEAIDSFSAGTRQ
ncbi:STAS domain-containing protein [Prosthecochloris sp. SCSIO W1101]|uniref:STAS domain-containing protein n=1 Tax=Prosthecochloris sp. SCSIO W1101 TaxID=2992242 RepID=UPI00223D3F29|nr:STAS domain-containing protein [Prosthecochloris sp. SCSIO W1101]UZJ41322.1 STAS domain-containing protein [Prosthecochloris sp. SCSIO W1101]